MATREEPVPSALDWAEANNIWSLQRYVELHPYAGDDTRASALAWTKAFAMVTEYESQVIRSYADPG